MGYGRRPFRYSKMLPPADNVRTMSTQPAPVREVERRKWQFLILFVIVDLFQIAFVSVLTLDSSSLFIIGFDPSRTSPVVSGGLFVGIVLVQVMLLYYMALSMTHRQGVVEIWPSSPPPQGWTCRHSRDSVVQWTLDLAKQSDVSVDRIYLLDSPIPNAFTFGLPLIGNIVVLHNNILSLLNPSEVRAVIAHETAHIKNRDTLVQILARMPEFFIQVVYLYIYARLLLGVVDALLVTGDPVAVIARTAALLVFFILSRGVLTVGTALIQAASRAAELLADYHAATLLGPVVTVNALLRLGQRIEALHTLVEEARWLDSLNESGIMPLTDREIREMVIALGPDELDDRVARVKAPHLFLRRRLEVLRDAYGLPLTDSDIQQLVRPAAVELVRRRSRDIVADTSVPKKIDWRSADIDGDRRLSESELRRLVAELRNDPSGLLFDNEIGKNILVLDHPDFRRRVLFLADVFGL